VFEVASSDLLNMGLSVVSYTLKDIRDEEGYLKALGMARTAQVCVTSDGIGWYGLHSHSA